MKKVTIVFDFESQSMDVSVNDARECVINAATVEEMLAKEVFAFRPVKMSHYVVLHYADIVCVKASNNNSVFHMADGSSFTVGKKLEVVEKFLRESPCGGFVRVNRSTPFHLPKCILYFHRYCSILSSVFYIYTPEYLLGTEYQAFRPLCRNPHPQPHLQGLLVQPARQHRESDGERHPPPSCHTGVQSYGGHTP